MVIKISGLLEEEGLSPSLEKSSMVMLKVDSNHNKFNYISRERNQKISLPRAVGRVKPTLKESVLVVVRLLSIWYTSP